MPGGVKPTDDYFTPAAAEAAAAAKAGPKKLTVAQKRLAKTNKKGMKPLTSFFGGGSKS